MKKEGGLMRNKNSRILITILGGWFGLHRYLDRKIVSGLIYTFTFGVFGIGWLIDVYHAFTISNLSKAYNYTDLPSPDQTLSVGDRTYKLAYSYDNVELYTMTPFSFSIPSNALLGFRTEPNNDYDKRAIYFLWNNTNIGYIHIGRLQDMMHDYMRPDRYIIARYEEMNSDNNVLITLSFYKESN